MLFRAIKSTLFRFFMLEFFILETSGVFWSSPPETGWFLVSFPLETSVNWNRSSNFRIINLIKFILYFIWLKNAKQEGFELLLLLDKLKKFDRKFRLKNYTRNEWRRSENHTRNEWGRSENTLKTSGENVHWNQILNSHVIQILVISFIYRFDDARHFRVRVSFHKTTLVSSVVEKVGFE
jgi:hypothetical protein